MKMPSLAIYYDSGNSNNSNNNNIDNSECHPSEKEEEEMPIAWGFMSVDGSLATLHVEPEHRGQGLAVTLSKEIMRRAMTMTVDKSQERKRGIFRFRKEDQSDSSSSSSSSNNENDDRDAWAHADVATTNIASRRVMEKIGGKIAWTDTWTVIEVCDVI